MNYREAIEQVLAVLQNTFVIEVDGKKIDCRSNATKAAMRKLEELSGIEDIKAFYDRVQDSETDETANMIKATEIPLSELGLSARTYNALLRSDIHNLSDLTGMTRDQLYLVRGMGRKEFDEVEQMLYSRGLSFRKAGGR